MLKNGAVLPETKRRRCAEHHPCDRLCLHPHSQQHLPSSSPSSWPWFGSLGEAGEPTTPHLPHAHPTPPTSRSCLTSSCSTGAGCYPRCPAPCPLCLAMEQQGLLLGLQWGGQLFWESQLPSGNLERVLGAESTSNVSHPSVTVTEQSPHLLSGGRGPAPASAMPSCQQAYGNTPEK